MILKYKNGGVAQLTSTVLARINCEACVYGDNNGVNQIACLKVKELCSSKTFMGILVVTAASSILVNNGIPSSRWS